MQPGRNATYTALNHAVRGEVPGFRMRAPGCPVSVPFDVIAGALRGAPGTGFEVVSLVFFFTISTEEADTQAEVQGEVAW